MISDRTAHRAIQGRSRRLKCALLLTQSLAVAAWVAPSMAQAAGMPVDRAATPDTPAVVAATGRPDGATDVALDGKADTDATAEPAPPPAPSKTTHAAKSGFGKPITFVGLGALAGIVGFGANELLDEGEEPRANRSNPTPTPPGR